MKRIIIYVLVVVLLIGIALTGCTDNSDDGITIKNTETPSEDDALSQTVNLTPKGELPIISTKGQIQLSILTCDDNDLNNNTFLAWYSDITNISLDLRTVKPSSFKSEINIMFNSGSAADIISSLCSDRNIFTRTDVLQLGAQELITPLNDMVDEWSINFINYLDNPEWPMVRDLSHTSDGILWGLPALKIDFPNTYPNKLVVNKVWLEKLEMQIPTTPDELVNLLVLFRDTDMNTNGQTADEIPLYALTNDLSHIDGYLMSSFVYSSAVDNWLYLDGNHTVLASYKQPGFRKGLIYLNKLYRENLLYSSILPDETNAVAKIIKAGDGIVNFVGAVVGNELPGKINWDNWIAVPPLKNPFGEMQTVNLINTDEVMSPASFITSDCENPIAAFRWLDEQWDAFDAEFDEFPIANTARYGVYETDWIQADPGTLGINGRPAVLKAIVKSEETEDDDDTYTVYTTFTSPGLPYSWQLPVSEDDTPFNKLHHLWQVTNELYAPYAYPNDLVIPPMFLDSETKKELDIIESKIDTTVSSYRDAFIKGDLDIEDDEAWQTFQDEIDGLNFLRYIEIYQEGVDRLKK